MKFIRITLSFNLKAILLLTLLLSNIFVSANETIKLNKSLNRLERKLTSHKSTKAKTNTKSTKVTTRRALNLAKALEFHEKFKAFLKGFVSVLIKKVTKALDDTLEDTVAGTAKDLVDACFEKAIKHYETTKKQIESISTCNPEIINDLLGKEHVEILNKCAELEVIRKADSNEYSSLNVLMNSVVSVFTDNSEFEKKYKAFKEDKERLEALSSEWSKKYKSVFEKKKNDKTGTPKPVRKVARTLFKAMDKIFSKDICEAISGCESFGPLDKLKVIFGTSVGMLECAATSYVKGEASEAFKALVKNIFGVSGMKGLVTSLLTGIFPGVLIGVLIKFVISNWSTMKKFVLSSISILSDDPNASKAEKDLWSSVGKLLAAGLLELLGARRRKLKKFRKFDERLF